MRIARLLDIIKSRRQERMAVGREYWRERQHANGRIMLMRLLIVLLCLGLTVYANLDNEAPTVKIPLGGIKGYYKLSTNGRKYEAYEGIPYALPPVGKLRFKPPRQTPAWIGELSATKFASSCIQYSQVPLDIDKVEGSEDCLYLNIYVPVQKKTANRPLMPVFFWIHGGAFQFGTGTIYSGKHLLDHDVIFVTINYRLGPMGFLSTEDEIVPGNMGLKDQSMALRWVSDNIEWFGGDPKKITLVGLSAGGASVHYHYLSKMSAGLFQGGISVSGTAFDCWAQTENSLEKAKKLSVLMGCPTINSREMIRCLQYRPARSIIHAVGEFMPFMYNPFTPFGPVAEKAGDAPFIDRTPFEIINSGEVQDVPWITSVVSEEGLYPVAEFIAKEDKLKELNDNWDVLGPQYLDFNYTLPREKHVETARLIKYHYFGTNPIDRYSTAELVKMSSDRFFIVDAEKAVRMQAKMNKSPVWYYYYSYRATESLSIILSGGNTDNYGVCHGDDVLLVIDTPYVDATKTQDDRDIQKVLIDIWLSFAIDRAPSLAGINWPKLDPSKNELHYLHISGPTEIKMESNTDFGQKNFWDSIDFNENKVQQRYTTRTEF